jgi:hypothetical protein
LAFVNTKNLMVWNTLKEYLPVGTRLTSAYRSDQMQLNLIISRAEAGGFHFAKTPSLADKSSWQKAYAFLRKQKDYKKRPIAPPGKSMHARGIAYDLTGPDLQKIKKDIETAVADGKIKLLQGSQSNLLIESRARCVHVEIEAAEVIAYDWDFV